jgi:cytoskeleton protein RodZ
MTSDNNNLKKIRTDKGLSVQEVANKLKLTTDVINKLESSEFENLGAYTYIRGYINHYTSLLGVDAQQYLDLVDKSKHDVPLVNTGSNLTKGIKLRRQSKSFANYVLGTFVVILVSFSGWYLLKNYTGFAKNKSKNIELVMDQNDLAIKPQNETSVENDSIITNENSLNQEGDKETYHYSSLIPATDLDNQEKNTEDKDEIAIPNQTTQDVSNETVNEEKALDASNYKYQISIEALETSWVKVEHEDGSKLHNDLLQPGLVSFQSNDPVHFRIGNGDKVKVTINGEEVDLSKYSRKNIADFTWPVDS